MQGVHTSLAVKLRYYTSLSSVYIVTIALGWFVLHPVARPHTQLVSLTQPQQSKIVAMLAKPDAISGKPVRIVLPASGLDLPIDEGVYDTTNGWTLSGYHAQFAVGSSPANNQAGDTFIYGHNNNYVFGALRHRTPDVGEQALIYTDNGHVFSYLFQSTASLTPDDTSVLSYQGPPVLTIQTCTGSFNEWRTLFRFSFDKVVQ